MNRLIHVVLDTNVIISGILGLIRAPSTPGVILRSWLDGEFTQYVSAPILREVIRTLDKPYFARAIPPERVQASVQLLKEFGKPVDVSNEISGIATHPEDDLILATAVSAGAGYLVTGDRMLQELGTFRGVKIVSPGEFLDILNRNRERESPSERPDFDRAQR